MEIIDIINLKERLDKTLMDNGGIGATYVANEKAIYEHMAYNYAQTEGAIAVLSDMYTRTSSIYYGYYSQALGIEEDEQTTKIGSIWEDALLQRIHPDDISEKYLQELQFYNFILRQPRQLRQRYHLESDLRMRDKCGNYIATRHRMYYIYPEHSAWPWLALCLYLPPVAAITGKGVIVDAHNGDIIQVGGKDSVEVLSVRERQILRLIDQGMTSKQIAAALSISINTVNRHRQAILMHLKVKNSIEACRLAHKTAII